MKKILISWLGYNKDFMIQPGHNRERKLKRVNEDGPSFNVHRYFGDEYEKHILLNGNNNPTDIADYNLLIKELQNAFKKHVIEPRNLFINDPINVSEVFEKANKLLAEYAGEMVDVFISPGTPAMQTAWYLLGSHYQKTVTLFQLRGKEHTTDKLKPRKEIVQLDRNVLQTNLTITQQIVSDLKVEKKNLITESIKPIYDKAKLIGATDDVGCLILGEHGTGKEDLANHIHTFSNRRTKNFIAVNCAAFTDELLGSELFGHVKGSFTGAHVDSKGKFEEADGGTIFLDEIGDISPKMQVSLLRVLQEHKIRRLGSNNEIPVNVRVLFATNRDLERLCREDKFRWDLYYRINIPSLKLPPLRARGKKEISALIDFINRNLYQRFTNQKKQLLLFSKEAMNKLLNYSYPGNIRELQNMMINFYTYCEQEVGIEDVESVVTKDVDLPESIDETEKQQILRIYYEKKENVSAAAAALKMSRQTLYNKLKLYRLK